MANVFTIRAFLLRKGAMRFLFVSLDEIIQFAFNLNNSVELPEFGVGSEYQLVEQQVPEFKQIDTGTAGKLGADVYLDQPEHEFWRVSAIALRNIESEWYEGWKQGKVPPALHLGFFRGQQEWKKELAEKFGHKY